MITSNSIIQSELFGQRKRKHSHQPTQAFVEKSSSASPTPAALFFCVVFSLSRLSSSRFCIFPSPSLDVTQTRGSLSMLFCPLPTTVRAFYFFFARTTVNPFFRRRLALNCARRGTQCIRQQYPLPNVTWGTADHSLLLYD